MISACGMLGERRRDLRVEFGDALIEGQDVAGELGDDARGDVLAGQGYPLGLRRGDGPGGDAGIAAHAPLPQPAGQAGLPDPADPGRAGIAGQQHQGTLAGGVVELPLQAGKTLVSTSRSRLIIRTRSAIRSARWPVSRPEVADQVSLVVDDRQVPPDPGGLGDHVGVLGIGLALSRHRRRSSPRRAAPMRNGPAGRPG